MKHFVGFEEILKRRNFLKAHQWENNILRSMDWNEGYKTALFEEIKFLSELLEAKL